MSQLVKAITATDTGNVRRISDSFSPLFNDLVSITSKIKESTSFFTPHEICKEYVIGVEIKDSVLIADNLSHCNQSQDAIEAAIRMSKLKIIEAIFGEFRQDFYRIQTALNQRDHAKASSLLVEFEKKMYEDI